MGFGTDVGVCVTKLASGSVKLFCLGADERNYCCRADYSTSPTVDNGVHKCCTHKEFSDQHWVTLGSIKGYTILMAILFLHCLATLAWFYWTSRDISESEARITQRQIMKHLLKRDLISKSKGSDAGNLMSKRGRQPPPSPRNLTKII